MTDVQIEALARTRGFPAVDIEKVRQRVGTLVGGAAKPAAAAAARTSVVREQPPTPAPPAPQPPSAVFGASLFSNASLTFEPDLRIATPRHYIVGPDDELIIDVYGNAQQTYRPRVSPEGSIRVENLSPIQVSGLTIEQAEQRIVGRLKTLYQGLNAAGGGVMAQVTLGSVRSIKVTMLGQVVRPGTYTLSSLATVFNALYASGGPMPERGSFRDVRVYRNNRLVRRLDMYDFLLRADQKDNIRLNDQDVIFVDHYRTRIELAGEVKQPGLYEVRPGETIQTVLAFSGGFSDRAYTASISLRRNTPTEQQLITIPTAVLPEFIPQAGDRYLVGAILDRIDNKVSIEGAVFRPGTYEHLKNLTLRQLVRTAEGLREDAFLNRATIHRLRENIDPELISVDLGKVMRQEQPDVPLRPNDRVQISALNDLREQRTVSVLGAVNRGGTFAFTDSMTVASLVLLAGGFTDAAIASRMEIARRIRNDTAGLTADQTIRLLSFAIDRDLRLRPIDARLTLQPFDQVYVRASPRYETQQGAMLAGEVLYPGPYAIRAKSDRISDLIARAGGLSSEAYPSAARFMRQGERVSVDLNTILDDPALAGNLLLQDGDVLTIPRRPELIRIQGEVLNPATVAFEPSKSLRDYIDEAGGFTSKAMKRKIYAVAASGKIRRTRSWCWVPAFPRPERGMDIVVPAKRSKDQPRLSASERITVLTVIVSASALLVTALRAVTAL